MYLPSQIPNDGNSRNGLIPVAKIAAKLPPLEDLKSLKSEMAAIRGEMPTQSAVVAVLEALGDVPLVGFIEHLKGVHPRYRLGGHKAVTKWKWFEITAQSYAEAEAQAKPHGAAGDDQCRHGKPDGTCPQCPDRAGFNAAMEAF